MHRITLLKRLDGITPSLPTWIILFATLTTIAANQSVVSAQPAQRPNFLLIVTDDQSPSTLGAYGNEVCHTPNIDRLAREGMLLHDAHHMGSWSGAVCLTSRTMLMTGRTLWRIPGAPVGAAGGQLDAKLAAQSSLPALFNAAGYRTFRTCKQGNSFAAANALFQVRHEATRRGGDPEQGSAWHAERALEFLADRRASRDKVPFLMFLGFSHPHDPRHGSSELLQKYGAQDASQPPHQVNPLSPPLPINYLPAHPFPHGHPGLRDETQVSGVFDNRSEATVRNEIGREYACIENIDRQVGRVLEELSELEELDHTFVFFTSDHGISVGRHGLMGKQNLYEHTWRVPFLIRGPGISAGQKAEGYIYLLDMLPTLCDLAGIAIPSTVEGLSFRPVLEGRAERIRDTVYGAYSGGTKPGMRSVKTDGWKLIKYDVLEGSVRETQLFHLRENPAELLLQHHQPAVVALTKNLPEPQEINLANDPEHAEKLQQMEALLLAEQKRLGDPYRMWDQDR